MKRFLVILLSVFMLLALAGCNSNKNTNSQPDVNKPADNNASVVGAYENNRNEEAQFDEATAALFENAAKDVTALNLKPLALLSTQVVAGTNYAFLCETSSDENPQSKYVITYVYEDLNGSSEVLGVTNLVTGEDTADENLLGGWFSVENNFAAVNEECSKVLEKVTDWSEEATYELVCCLSHQVVAGLNHQMLCKETLNTENPVSKYVVITVYENVNGECSISDIKPLTISLDSEMDTK